MKALLWKDLRLFSNILLLGAILLVGPYVTMPFYVFNSDLFPLVSEKMNPWSAILSISSFFSLCLCHFPLVMLAAHSMAYERADRSLAFLFTLPPTRFCILTSKVIIIGCFLATVWSVNGVAILIASQMNHGPVSITDGYPPLRAIAVFEFFCFGASWLASAYSANPAHALAFSLVAPLMLLAFFWMTMYWFRWPTPSSFGAWYEQSSIILSQVCFALGIIRFLTKVEP
jgi:ABC-type Na+ efflux pump permease subunit